MEFIEVESSTIKSVAYDDRAKQLHVEFVNGSRYVYDGVQPIIFECLKKADSKGKFLNENIRGYYNYSRVK